MIRRNPITQEFNFLSEILPITLVAVLLNIAGRLLAERLDLLFVDMIGTAFAALLLGPWWAASVAAATTIVNGGFFEIYFPFGVVNIAGALAWGYLGRAVGIRGKVFSEEPGRLPSFVLWTVILWLVGALVCGLASSVVKIILFPQMERPLVLGDYYVKVQTVLDGLFGGQLAPAVILIAGDLGRDLFDKAIVVTAAMLIVRAVRISPTISGDSGNGNLLDRLRTDVQSVFCFAVVFSAFILLAQLIKPVLSYPGGLRAVTWLKSPAIVALLYAPLILAVLAFVLLTYRPSNRYARHLDGLRQFRSYVFGCVFNKTDKVASLQAAQGLQPLSVGLSLWSFRSVIDQWVGIPLSVFVIFIAIAVYVIMVRTVYPRLRTAAEEIVLLRSWLQVSPRSHYPGSMLQLFGNLLTGFVSNVRTDHRKRNDIAYFLAFATDRRPSRFAQALFGHTSGALSQRVTIVALVEGEKSLTPQIAGDLRNLARETGAGHVAVLSATARVGHPDILRHLHDIRSSSTELLLFDWTDITMAIGAKTLETEPLQAIQRARVRFLENLSMDERVDTATSNRPLWLASRALPRLKFVIDHLDKGSRVFDLGAGYGRHSFVALAAGHSVVAIERKPEVVETLRRDATGPSVAQERMSIILDDYLNVAGERIGIADLVILTGVLQHSRDESDLERRLGHAAGLASGPGAIVYIEMLLDMLFDGKPAADGRVAITQQDFEVLLRRCFPPASWSVEQSFGPVRQLQTFPTAGRSFQPPASHIESTAIEYLIRRLD